MDQVLVALDVVVVVVDYLMHSMMASPSLESDIAAAAAALVAVAPVVLHSNVMHSKNL